MDLISKVTKKENELVKLQCECGAVDYIRKTAYQENSYYLCITCVLKKINYKQGVIVEQKHNRN